MRRRDFGGLDKSICGWRPPLAGSRHQAGTDVAQHGLGVLWSCGPLLEGRERTRVPIMPL